MNSSPPGYRHRHALLFDAVGGERDRLQARRAEAVDGLRRRRHRQAGADGALAGDVAAGRAFGIGAAHHHVLDVARIDAGALDGVGDHMPAHVGAVGEVEGAAHGSADRRAGGGDDDGVDHGVGSFYRVCRILRVRLGHGTMPQTRACRASRQSAGAPRVRGSRRRRLTQVMASALIRRRPALAAAPPRSALFSTACRPRSWARHRGTPGARAVSCRPSLSARNARNSSSVKGSAPASTARTPWPPRRDKLSGTPITITSATAGCS